MTDGHATKIVHEPFFGKLVMHDFVHNLFSEHVSPTIMYGDHPTCQTSIMHTTTVLRGQNDLTMILARSSQDVASSQDHKQDPPMWDLSVQFYLSDTQT